jgi:hypothetical protein
MGYGLKSGVQSPQIGKSRMVLDQSSLPLSSTMM